MIQNKSDFFFTSVDLGCRRKCTISRPKTFVSQRKNEGLGRCFGHRVERSLTLAGELIYNPIAQ
ncbi:MAG: hypothetical protein KME30_32515, partial [Iphinoe sp. HA4291-MV1]|nr:hypothetical protein [Iphinoe sp. HA4291-MV1]